ncbi:hypothetical protein, partial [Laribacter hongkongensis]|uniref:hypothetical protein n=1 Tax=Laribacter hongkongensis TaxID=168471 RepID=UPI001D0CD521
MPTRWRTSSRRDGALTTFFAAPLASLTRPDIREERPQASRLPVPGCGGKDCPARGFALLGAG